MLVVVAAAVCVGDVYLDRKRQVPFSIRYLIMGISMYILEGENARNQRRTLKAKLKLQAQIVAGCHANKPCNNNPET